MSVPPNKILFEHANIKVSDSRFDTGYESFAIRKISGIRIEREKRNARTGSGLVVAGVLALLGGLLGNLPILIVAGAACIVGGTMLWVAKVNRSVVLTTRGKDVKALTSKDGALIEAVAAALHAAIEQRR